MFSKTWKKSWTVDYRLVIFGVTQKIQHHVITNCYNKTWSFCVRINYTNCCNLLRHKQQRREPAKVNGVKKKITVGLVRIFFFLKLFLSKSNIRVEAPIASTLRSVSLSPWTCNNSLIGVGSSVLCAVRRPLDFICALIAKRSVAPEINKIREMSLRSVRAFRRSALRWPRFN